MEETMIFIGYSHQDRYKIVESIIFHLKNYGFDVWYDFHDMYLGSNRIKENFEYGIKSNKYIIFVMSDNIFSSTCAMEELDFARELYEKNEIVFLPIFYNYKADNLPRDYEWIKKIIYNEVTDKSGTIYVINQIIERILNDFVFELQFKNFESICHVFENSNNYLYSVINAYTRIDLDNYNTRLGILYSIYLYIKSLSYDSNYPSFCEKVITRLHTFTRLNISIDHLSFNIFQLTALIVLNDLIDNLNN